VTARAGNRRAAVTFRPRSATGPVTYGVIASPGGAHASGTHSPITVRGLRNGRHYRFRVVATNTGGTSASSPMSRAATPFAPPRLSRASIRGAARRAPRIAFTVAAGRHSPRLVSVAVALPRGLRFDARQVAAHVLVAGHRPRGTVRARHGVLTISLRHPAAQVAVRITAPGVSVTASLARAVRRRRPGRKTLTLTIGDSARNHIALKLRLRPS
jgi:hypothetical protein